MIKTGMEYIKFIYTTPICNQRPSNDNWRGKRDEDYTAEDKQKLRERIFNNDFFK